MTKTGTIDLVRVCRSFKSPRHETLVAVRDLSANVRDQEFLSIIGPSGCGKSTLLKMIAGIMPTTSGEIVMGDVPVRGAQKGVGMVFQQPRLLPWRTVMQNVLLPTEILRYPRRQARSEAESLLELVGLQQFGDRPAYELSGGMQQRVAICRALVHDPAVLLMDEPFGALDAITRESMSHELLRLWEERRKTVVFVTHSIHEALLLSDRILVMTPRPGTIRETVCVDLPRPRVWDTEYDEKFLTLVRHLKGMLQDADE